MAGETIGDRINPLDPDAKVIVRPITDLDPTYQPVEKFRSPAYQERLRTARCIAHMLGDRDVVIYVPPEVPQDAAIAAEHIARDSVKVLLSDSEDALRATLPANGIILRFDSGIGDREFFELQNQGD